MCNLAHGTDLDDVEKLAGCYLVDYSYSEHKGLDPDYKMDPWVYDVQRMTVKEWVQVVARDEKSVRLQHFMQADNTAGQTSFMMRHHAEIWEKQPEYRYRYLGRFDGEDRWDVEDLTDRDDDVWIRKITHLDDVLRYQCVGSWTDAAFPYFDCGAFSLIPGRETRDMGRKDYQTLDRTTRVVMYPQSWLERQKNIKMRFEDDVSTPLVEEVGKIWSVRLPDEECAPVQEWASKRQDFWNILDEFWDEVYADRKAFYEKAKVDGTTRSSKVSKLQKQYGHRIGSDSLAVQELKEKIYEVIQMHRYDI